MTAALTGAQISIYTSTPEELAAFYKLLGMVEWFRFPAAGRVDQLELSIEGFTLGFSSREALSRLAGIATEPGGPRSEIVLWCCDVHGAYGLALEGGAKAVAPPRCFNNRINAAWLEDPEGNRLKLVSKLT